MVIVIMMLLAGLYLLARSLRTRTAFVALLIMEVVLSFMMAINAVSFGFGIFLAIIISLAILWADENGILA